MKHRLNCLKAEETGRRGVKMRLTPDMTEGCVKNHAGKKKEKKKAKASLSSRSVEIFR